MYFDRASPVTVERWTDFIGITARWNLCWWEYILDKYKTDDENNWVALTENHLEIHSTMAEWYRLLHIHSNSRFIFNLCPAPTPQYLCFYTIWQHYIRQHCVLERQVKRIISPALNPVVIWIVVFYAVGLNFSSTSWQLRRVLSDCSSQKNPLRAWPETQRHSGSLKDLWRTLLCFSCLSLLFSFRAPT